MTIDGGTVIILLYLLVSVGVIVAFVLILAGGLDWVADGLRERRRASWERGRNNVGESGPQPTRKR
jgi:hypothetical protein